MEIIFYHPTFNTAWWVNALEKALHMRAFVNGRSVITTPQTMRLYGSPRLKCWPEDA